MTKSLPSEDKIANANMADIRQKSFFELSAIEIEQLAVEATTRARRRMHDKGISTIISLNGSVYEEHSDGTLILLHEQIVE